LFAASFWIAQKLVQSTVRNELLASLRARQLALRDAKVEADLQNNRFLRIEGKSPELKSGLQLLLSESSTGDVRSGMEDQLRVLGAEMGFDLLFVSAPNGPPVAGVVRGPAANPDQKPQLMALGNVLVAQPASGLLVLGDRIFQFASAPIDADAENVGTLFVGQYFRLPQPAKPTVLFHDGEVIDFNFSNVVGEQVQEAMKGCAGRQECDFQVGGANWLGIPMQDLGSGYTLWSLGNLDEVTSPIGKRLRNLFLVMEFGTLLIALLGSIVSSRSIEKPIALVISQLRKAEQTGVLPESTMAFSSTTEMRELMESYTIAAKSARTARQQLESAYVEFIGSLANALDARDRYTSGHSGRVAKYASLTAAAMGLGRKQVEQIRISAQLHDIGKIGIPDSVLQKPGRLTVEELAMIQEHTVIGRRILEGVEGLASCLDGVELHHENWDGSGYPRLLSGEEIPIAARIIHVADAYDAMTTHRSYRPGRTHEQANHELMRCAGTEFDPRIVEVFLDLPSEVFSGSAAVPDDHSRVHELEAAEAD
jgi:HD-GYP domain-containing protein (c-di-GMP phosphodiesterase class II)